MLKEIKDLIKATLLIVHSNPLSISEQIPRIFPDKNTNTIYPNYDYAPLWEQHIHYNALPAPYVTRPMDSSHASFQSLEILLALPALPSTSAIMVNMLDAHSNVQTTSTANMVMPSNKIASATSIISTGIVWWAAMAHAADDPCHI
uniref:Uncharacterized protein n=1 Tax=Romanomermis culicivorax TaxID=13658 RepID=A0A915IYL3_ROMCU